MPSGHGYRSSDGCELHPHCTECPEERCIFDSTVAINPARLLRNREIAKQAKEGKTVGELAKSFKLCRTTISRVLKEELTGGKSDS